MLVKSEYCNILQDGVKGSGNAPATVHVSLLSILSCGRALVRKIKHVIAVDQCRAKH